MAVAAQAASPEPARLAPAATTAFGPAFEYTVPGGHVGEREVRRSSPCSRSGLRESPPCQARSGGLSSRPRATPARPAAAGSSSRTSPETPMSTPARPGGPSRVPVRGQPAAFLEDLRALGGLRLEDDGVTALGGRPAHAVIASQGTDCGLIGDIHISGFRGNYVVLGDPIPDHRGRCRWLDRDGPSLGRHTRGPRGVAAHRAGVPRLDPLRRAGLTVGPHLHRGRASPHSWASSSAFSMASASAPSPAAATPRCGSSWRTRSRRPCQTHDHRFGGGPNVRIDAAVSRPYVSPHGRILGSVPQPLEGRP